MLRHILVCLKPVPENRACQEAAVDIARHVRGVLSGVYVRALPPVASPLVNPMAGLVVGESGVSAGLLREMDERVLEHEAEQDRRQSDSFDGFLRKARSHDVRAGTLTRTGEVQEELVRSGQATDLVMLGRGGRREDSLLGSVAGAIVRSVARPVMIVPEWREKLEKIAVAYDGSPGADRALAMAAELALSWGPSHPEIALIGIVAQDADSLTFLEPARRYLNACDLSYHVRTAPGDPATLINALALNEDASLLAMGAYGHSLMREVLLGSTTQNVLAVWTRPILLCH